MEATAVAISSLGKSTREEARSANAEWTSAGLRASLRRLDCLLEWAMQSLPPECACSSSAPFRGLILTRGDIARRTSWFNTSFRCACLTECGFVSACIPAS
jgi:hypothetical protein